MYVSALFVAVTIKDGCPSGPSLKFQWKNIKNSVVPTRLELRNLNSNETVYYNVPPASKSGITVTLSEACYLVAGDSYLASIYFNDTTNITRADLVLTTSEYLNNLLILQQKNYFEKLLSNLKAVKYCKVHMQMRSIQITNTSFSKFCT
jgi:hypothetical protein